MDYSQFTSEQQEMLRLSDEDYKRIIAQYVEGQKFDTDFIKSLNLENSREECIEYNERIDDLNYAKSRISSFTNYIQTMKSWY